MNNWNLYQGDGDVICTAGTSHESQGKIRNNTFINTDTHRLAGSFTSGNHCGSLFLSVTCLQMSPSSNASPPEQPQNTEATKMGMRKTLPNTFEKSQGLDPSGEKLRNKINNMPRKPRPREEAACASPGHRGESCFPGRGHWSWIQYLLLLLVDSLLYRASQTTAFVQTAVQAWSRTRF